MPGTHYARTSEAWLERLAVNADEIERRWGRAYLERWRIFFLACAELFAYRGGTEWLVAHSLFSSRGETMFPPASPLPLRSSVAGRGWPPGGPSPPPAAYARDHSTAQPWKAARRSASSATSRASTRESRLNGSHTTRGAS